jgi:hypothetical protein
MTRWLLVPTFRITKNGQIFHNKLDNLSLYVFSEIAVSGLLDMARMWRSVSTCRVRRVDRT